MSLEKNSSHKVNVVGAGIIGVVCALSLLREGHQVTLIDMDLPGQGCSFGNAGLLACSSFVPLSSPGTLLQVPFWLLRRDGPLSIRWRYLPKLAAWLFGYIKAGFSNNLIAKGEAMNQLTSPSLELYQSLARSAGCEDLVKESDYLQVYRSMKGLKKAEAEMDERRRLGFDISTIHGSELHELEPDLSPVFRCAHHVKNHGFVKDPEGLVLALFAQFEREGGKFIKDKAESISQQGDECLLKTSTQSISSDKLLIAAGAFSARLISSSGIKISLETERGYHITCRSPKVSLNRPIMEGDKKFLATPMNMGIRFAGTVELAGLDAPLNPRRIKSIEHGALAMMPGLDITKASPWMGFRPTLCDSLPVISKAPDSDNIIYAFGHQHLGLTCAPATSSIVCDLIANRTPDKDITLFDVKRLL
ncbi:MAG: FAD-binding oxidoreductase [Pseudomonadales bacterium]